MWNLLSLDGYFEGPKSWDLDFHKYAWGDELDQFSKDQLKTVGALLYGRVTYEGMASYWSSQKDEKADYMNNLPKIVFSKTLKQVTWNNTRLVKGDAAEEVMKLKQLPGKDLFVFGSANLSSTFIQKGLFDEYRLCLVPVILGQGNPLFKPGQEKIAMKLLETRPLKTGGVILRYQPESPKT